MTELKPQRDTITVWRCPECGASWDREEDCVRHIDMVHAPPTSEASALVGRYIAYSDPTAHVILRADTARGSRVAGRAVRIQRDDYVEIPDYHWVDVGADSLRILSGEDEARELWTLWVAELAERRMDAELKMFDAIREAVE